VGKSYRVTIDVSAYTSGTIPMILHDGGASALESLFTLNDSSGANGDGTGIHTHEFTLSTTPSHDDRWFIGEWGNTWIGTLTSVSIVQIGAVAEYDGSGAGEKIWGDKSGNDLHGTVSGATLENTPYDSGTEYEEGTWSPVVSDGSTDMAMHSSADTGYYTKVGNLVTVSGLIGTTSLNGLTSELIRITGLPFTVANDNAAYSGGGAANGAGLDIDPIYSVSYYGVPNATYMQLEVWDVTTGISSMLASEWTADGSIIIGFSYRAA